MYKLKWNFHRHTKFSFMKLHLKMASAKWRPFCPRGDEIGGLVQDSSISIANAMEILQSCTKTSRWYRNKRDNLSHTDLSRSHLYTAVLPSRRQNRSCHRTGVRGCHTGDDVHGCHSHKSQNRTPTHSSWTTGHSLKTIITLWSEFANYISNAYCWIKHFSFCSEFHRNLYMSV